MNPLGYLIMTASVCALLVAGAIVWHGRTQIAAWPGEGGGRVVLVDRWSSTAQVCVVRIITGRERSPDLLCSPPRSTEVTLRAN